MRVLVTCGPSIEPIDQVRRLTNFATGELGVLLCNTLAQSGLQPVCLKAATASSPLPLAQGIECHSFTTNDDLAILLRQQTQVLQPVAAVLHTAALCDFRVSRVLDAAGEPLQKPKIPSTGSGLHLVLEPASKLIGLLRPLFPKAFLVGWKYELCGTPSDALARAYAQITNNRTDACVLNGSAYGEGFGFVEGIHSTPIHLVDKAALCDFLGGWLRSKLS